MSLGAELKRRLDIADEPLNKRLRLAEDVLSSPFFPALNREEVVLDWICSRITQIQDDKERRDCLTSLKNCLRMPINYKNFTTSFKTKLLQVLTKLISSKEETKDDPDNGENILILESSICVVENQTISSHFQHFIDEYFTFLNLILKNILQNCKNTDEKNTPTDVFDSLAKQVLTDLSNFTKNFGKKAVLVNAFIDSGILHTVLEFTYSSKFSYKALNICQSILFPLPSLQLYRNYLTVLIKGSSLTALIEETGEPLRTIVKVVDILLKHSNKNCEESKKCLEHFIKLFIYCSKTDEYLIFSFNVILTFCLGIEQNYIKIKGNISKIDLSMETVADLYLQNIKYLAENNANLNIAFSGGNNSSKLESKRNFLTFLQTATLKLLFTDLMPLQNMLLIIQSIIDLDPAILEPNISKIMPVIMTQKKNDKSAVTLYNSVMKKVLGIQFKLCRGPDFLPKLLPSLHAKLESLDEEQSKLIVKRIKVIEELGDASKLNKKIISQEDVFPEEVCSSLGKLGSELMSWQNIDLFTMLNKQLELYCISQFESNQMAPSTVVLTELVSSCICSFLEHSKMADQGIPQNVVKKFSVVFDEFGKETLSKFGKAVLNFPAELQILNSFLRVCHSYGQLKLLMCRYQPYYSEALPGCDTITDRISKPGDLSLLHSYLGSSEWKNIFKLVKRTNNTSCTDAMNSLILQKIITLDIHYTSSMDIKEMRSYALNDLEEFWEFLSVSDFHCNSLFSNLTESEIKMAANKIVSIILSDKHKSQDDDALYGILKKESVANNKKILSMILVECIRNLWSLLDSEKAMKSYKSIFQASESEDFKIKTFFENEIDDFNKYMASIGKCHFVKKSISIEKTIQIVDLMNAIPIEYLNENFQFTALFSLLAIKIMMKNNNTDDLKVIFEDIDLKCDTIILRIFELSYKSPNILELFPLNFVFENSFLDLTNETSGKSEFAYKILKQLFERLITKDSFKEFKQIVKYLKDGVHLSEKDCIKNNGFQISAILYITLFNYKKSNLPTEIKTVLVKSLNNIKGVISDVFEAVKWKHLLNKKEHKSMETENEITSVDLNKSLLDQSQLVQLDSVIGEDLKLVLLNIIEAFTILIAGKCDSMQEDDIKMLKCLTKGLALFSNVSLAALLDPNTSLHHLKGATLFINTVLKNQKHFVKNPAMADQSNFYIQIWHATTFFLQNSMDKNGASWNELSNLSIDNVKLIFEICDQKFFSQFVMKQLLNFNNFTSEDVTKGEKSSNRPIQVTKMIWSCFLNCNLKPGGKNDTRSNSVKQMCNTFYFWLRKTTSSQQGEYARLSGNPVDDEEEVSAEEKKETKIVSKENLEIMAAYFEIMVECVTTKKMVLSSSLIDIIIQLPVIVTFDMETCQAYGNPASLKVFTITFEKCVMLTNALLIHRSELLQDRWPCFLQGYRKLMKCLSTRSHADKLKDPEEIEALVKMALSLEKLTQSMVKNEKHDLSRIASYLIADTMANFQRSPVTPRVKFHLQNCVLGLLQLLDSHAIGFLMRNLPSRMLFQQIYQTYNSYYKYTGR